MIATKKNLLLFLVIFTPLIATLQINAMGEEGEQTYRILPVSSITVSNKSSIPLKLEIIHKPDKELEPRILRRHTDIQLYMPIESISISDVPAEELKHKW